MNFPTRFFLGFSLSVFVSSVGHYREVTPSLLTRPPRKTSKTNFVFVPFFRTGLQRYALFFNLQIFLQKFFIFSASQSFQELLSTRVFSNRAAKVRLFSLLPNFSAINFKLFLLHIVKAQLIKPIKNADVAHEKIPKESGAIILYHYYNRSLIDCQV